MTFQPYYSLHLLCEYYVELALATVVLTCLLSIWLYIKSFQRPNDTLLAKGGCSGYAVYDFYMGRELNPRSFSNSFDWKEFCELRPGLILWLIINLAMAIQQHRLTIINLRFNLGFNFVVNLNLVAVILRNLFLSAGILRRGSPSDSAVAAWWGAAAKSCCMRLPAIDCSRSCHHEPLQEFVRHEPVQELPP